MTPEHKALMEIANDRLTILDDDTREELLKLLDEAPTLALRGIARKFRNRSLFIFIEQE